MFYERGLLMNTETTAALTGDLLAMAMDRP